MVDPRRIDSRRLDARSVIAALTAVKGCHSLPLPSILLYDCKKKSTPLGAFLFGGPEENRFSQARRPLGHRGSDVPQARHSLPLPSILLYDCKKKSTPLGAFLFGGPEENRFSRARRPLGHRGSDVPPARHSLPLPSILPYDCKKKSTPLGAFLLVRPEENRTPVRKTIRGAFSERIPSFEIPSSQRRQTGCCVSVAFLMRDGVKS